MFSIVVLICVLSSYGISPIRSLETSNTLISKGEQENICIAQRNELDEVNKIGKIQLLNCTNEIEILTASIFDKVKILAQIQFLLDDCEYKKQRNQSGDGLDYETGSHLTCVENLAVAKQEYSFLTENFNLCSAITTELSYKNNINQKYINSVAANYEKCNGERWNVDDV